MNTNGGPTEVARKVGKTPQSFYNYANRGSMPNMEILQLIASGYPDFDANYILRGVPFSSSETELRKEIEYYKAIISKLIEK